MAPRIKLVSTETVAHSAVEGGSSKEKCEATMREAVGTLLQDLHDGTFRGGTLVWATDKTDPALSDAGQMISLSACFVSANAVVGSVVIQATTDLMSRTVAENARMANEEGIAAACDRVAECLVAQGMPPDAVKSFMEAAFRKAEPANVH